jgi:cell division protein FtsB
MEDSRTYTKAYAIDIEAAQKERREKRAQALKSRRRKVKAAKAEAEKARRSFITGRRFILVCVTAAVIFFVGSSAFRIMDLKVQEEEAAKELKARTEQKARLESELSALNDREYIEEQARERLGMVKPGEVVYVFEARGEDGAGAGNKKSADAADTADAATSEAGLSEGDGADAADPDAAGADAGE